MKTVKSQRGYIALTASILISISLLLYITTVSLEGFYSRLNIFSYTQKEKSMYLAEACIQTAIIKIAQNQHYLREQEELITVGSFTCRIISVGTGTVFTSNRLIKAQGQIGIAYTNLEVEVNPSTPPEVNILTWVEKTSF